MMDIQRISLDDFNQYMKADPRLCYMSLSDQSLDYLHHKGTVVLSPESELYGIYNDENELVCCFQLDPWTSICSLLHMYLKSELHHTGIVRKIRDSVIEYVKENLKNLKKIVIYVPAPCDQVHTAVKAFGFSQEGIITGSYIWRLQITDLYIYGLNLEGK